MVEHFLGLREATVIDAAGVVPIDTDDLPAETFLGVLGVTGLTAWLGITQVASVRPGDTVFVTGAAGAVGSIAGPETASVASVVQELSARLGHQIRAEDPPPRETLHGLDPGS